MVAGGWEIETDERTRKESKAREACTSDANLGSPCPTGVFFAQQSGKIAFDKVI
jgi:hypothetical protein